MAAKPLREAGKMEQRRAMRSYLVLAAAAFFCVALIMGLENNLYSLYLIPVTQTLGASRGAFSTAQSVRCLAALLSNLLFAGVCRRFGVRKPLIVCIAAVTVSYIFYARAQSVVPFFLGALVFGLGESFLNTAGMARLTANWFRSHHGVVMGVIMAASGLGGAVVGVLLAAVIEKSGWRASFYAGAGMMLATGLLAVFVIRDTPQERGVAAYDAPEKKRKRADGARQWEGYALASLFKKPYFYLAALSVLLCSIGTYGAYPSVTAHLQDQGMSATFAAAMYSLMMLLLAAAKVAIGALSDRAGAARSMLLCMLCSVLGIALLAVTKAAWQAVLMTALMGVCLCSQTFLQPLLASELFGARGAVAGSGILLAMVSAGGLIAPPVVNFSCDRLGSYTPVLLVLAAACAVSMALFFIAARLSKGDRARQMAARSR